ncbi:hypothetical protein [uncultured Microbulbifer sp.]|uniref:hypothetical protein n=1 Tax=uncultured Microbulbifer sp. TaxID=348147 RepID=UPI0026135368|nr:hypothetical protein [uncultured Microbulbifer sp.]
MLSFQKKKSIIFFPKLNKLIDWEDFRTNLHKACAKERNTARKSFMTPLVIAHFLENRHPNTNQGHIVMQTSFFISKFVITS